MNTMIATKIKKKLYNSQGHKTRNVSFQNNFSAISYSSAITS